MFSILTKYNCQFTCPSGQLRALLDLNLICTTNNSRFVVKLSFCSETRFVIQISDYKLGSSHQPVACVQPVVDSGNTVNIHYHFCQLLQNINPPFSEVRVVPERSTAVFGLYKYDNIIVGHGETFYNDRRIFFKYVCLDLSLFWLVSIW